MNKTGTNVPIKQIERKEEQRELSERREGLSGEELAWQTSPECYRLCLTEPPESVTQTMEGWSNWRDEQKKYFRKLFDDRRERERAELYAGRGSRSMPTRSRERERPGIETGSDFDAMMKKHAERLQMVEVIQVMAAGKIPLPSDWVEAPTPPQIAPPVSPQTSRGSDVDACLNNLNKILNFKIRMKMLEMFMDRNKGT